MAQSRVTGAISVSIAQAVVLLLGYMTHLWIGRVLGPAAYGIYGIGLSVQTIIGLFITMGVPAATTRFVARHPEFSQSILRQSLRVQTMIAFLIALGTLVISPLLANLLHDQTLLPYLWVVAAVVFSQAFYPIYVQFLSGMHLFHKQAALTIIYAVAKLAGAIALLYTFEVYGAFAGFAIGGFIAALVGFFWTRPKNRQSTYTIPLRELLSFAGSYVAILVGLQILMSLDLFMVKSILRDDAAAGYYNAAVTLSRIPYFLLQGLSFILLPSISALTKPGASHDKAAQFVKDVLRYLIAIIVPGITLAAATSKELVALFFSRAFITAGPILTVLIIGLGALAFYLLLVNIVAGAGKVKVAIGVTGAMLVLSVGIGSITIPRYGLIGAAWQTTIASIVGFIILTIYTFRSFAIPAPVRSTCNIILATIIAVLPTYVWKVGALFLPLQYIVLLGVYALCLILLKEITEHDVHLLQSIHPRLGDVSRRFVR